MDTNVNTSQLREATDKTEKKTNPGYERFIKATTGGDELVNMILRSHLLVEYYIDQLIMVSMPRGDLLTENSRITFAEKLKILKALDIFSSKSQYLIDSATGLNQVRNSCSHTLDYSISEADIDKVGKPMGTFYLKSKSANYTSLKQLVLDTLMHLIAHLDGLTDFSLEQKTSS